jgi:hypothetical protein
MTSWRARNALRGVLIGRGAACLCAEGVLGAPHTRQGNQGHERGPRPNRRRGRLVRFVSRPSRSCAQRVVISQGEIWWPDLPLPAGSGPGFRRPVVDVQCDAPNRSRVATVVCVPLAIRAQIFLLTDPSRRCSCKRELGGANCFTFEECGVGSQAEGF